MWGFFMKVLGCWGRTRRFLKSWPVIPVTVLFFVIVLPAAIPNQLAPHSPVRGDRSARLQPPAFVAGGSWEYPLGTDRLGRDVFSRIVHGARVSLSVALTGIVVGGGIGTLLGLIAGFYGGILDTVIMRLVETTMSIPLILLGLAFAVILGPSLQSMISVIALVLWAYYARQVRGEILAIRERDFVDYARVAGSSNVRIMVRDLLPNVANTLIVLATLQVARVIIMESTLTFLGVGLPRPFPAWGIMVADGRQYITTAWWISFFPGLAIVFVVMALNLLGDWLRDRFDPKLRQV